MFSDEPYSINKYGYVKDVETLSSDDIKTAWVNALSKAKILITVVGNTDIDKVYNHLLGEFKNINRNYIHLPNPVFVGKSEKVNNYIWALGRTLSQRTTLQRQCEALPIFSAAVLILNFLQMSGKK